jgi:hypothetical protein
MDSLFYYPFSADLVSHFKASLIIQITIIYFLNNLEKLMSFVTTFWTISLHNNWKEERDGKWEMKERVRNKGKERGKVNKIKLRIKIIKCKNWTINNHNNL